MPKKSEDAKSSKIPSWVLISIIVIVIVLLLCLCCDVVLSSEMSNTNTTVDDLNQTVATYDTSIKALEVKTTDLTYSNDVSTFSKTLKVGSKDIGNTLSKMSYENGDTVFDSDVIVTDGNTIYIGDMDILYEIENLNNALINGSFKVTELILENLTVTGTTKTKILTNSDTITTDKLVSNGITNTGNISTTGVVFSSGISNAGNIDTTGTLTANGIVNNGTLLANGISNNGNLTTSSINSSGKIYSPVYSCSGNYYTIPEISATLSNIGGMCVGTGDGSSLETFNLAIGSWNSTAFVDLTLPGTVKVLIDHRTGTITANNFVSNVGYGFPSAYMYNTKPENGHVEVIAVYPITFSMGYPPFGGIDDYWMINPGYGIETYTSTNYTGDPNKQYQFENFNGIVPKEYYMDNITYLTNTVKSFKVYYRSYDSANEIKSSFS